MIMWGGERDPHLVCHPLPAVATCRAGPRTYVKPVALSGRANRRPVTRVYSRSAYRTLPEDTP